VGQAKGGSQVAPPLGIKVVSSIMSDDSTVRRLVRFSDALRDAVQNPRTFQITPEEVENLNRLLERIDQLISRSRKM
jgi:hypothetical protein